MAANIEKSIIQRQSLPSAVAERLRDKILRGEIKEGEQLRQHAIAAQFNVSRIPVREAFRQLEAEGLITIIDHRGAIVSALSPEEIEELFQIRAVLESTIIKDAIPNITEDDLAKAEAALKEFEEALANSSETSNLGDLHWRFHSALYKPANRPRFMSILQTVNNNADRYIRLHIIFTKQLDQQSSDHWSLLELCRKRDANTAAKRLEEHITAAGRELKDFIQYHRIMEDAMPRR
ncbi:MAG TPA: GntR family transcriptional regulator [Blastocatellia bacterium]|nr:GntR family transcriptional regulator [Blastocatellia bacterium]